MLNTHYGKRSLIVCVFSLLMIPGIYGQVLASAPSHVTGEQLGDDVFNAGIRVKWFRPSHINGSLRGYEIIYSMTGVLGKIESILTGPSTTTVDINDVKYYTNYTILVRAQTLQGDGEWSSPMVFQTREGTPNALCEVTEIYATSPTTVFIRWKPLAPEFHRGVLSHYLVMWLAVSEHYTNYKYFSASLSTRNYTVTGLKPYSKYYMAIVGVGLNAGFYILEHMMEDASDVTTKEDVPSRSPGNLAAKLLCQEYTLKISWTALPEQSIHGKLQGYKVLLYQGLAFYKDASVTSERLTSLVPLNECKNYTIMTAAFTNAGAGPNSTTSVTSSCPCGLPQPLYSKRSIVVKEASSFTLPCEYQGRPEPTVFWLRNGKRLLGSTEILNISELSGNISYIDKESKQLSNNSWYVSYGKEGDSGYYACVMNNTFGLVTTGVKLSVTKGVATVKFQLTLNKTFHEDLYNERSAMYRELSSNVTEQIISLFSNTSETFNVKAAKVVRFRNGSVVAEMKIFATVSNPSLESLASKAIRDRLNHVLLGKTVHLGDLTVMEFNIQESPPAPRDPKVIEAKQTQLKFSWTAPKSHEAYVITSYNLQYRKVGKTTMISTDMLPAGQYSGVINGLTSNTAYEVVVVAYNKYGNQKSKIIRARTSDIPLALILSVTISGVLLVAFLVGLLTWCRVRKVLKKRKEAMIEFEQLQRDKTTPYYKVPHHNYDARRSSEIVREWWEIPRDYIQVGKELGSGAFGEVKKGVLTKDGETTTCAIKMLKRHATETEFRDLLNELNIMANVGEHPNIISLIGACTSDGPLWLVVKFAENGSLISYLQSNRQKPWHGYENIEENKSDLEYVEKLKFAYGIARGMNHLAKQRCVHRDLAARNVLLGENNRPMVSDFGLSRDIYESGQYEKKSGGKLPVKWMAIESLNNYVYTTQSDVWSYGVVLWEIESEGRIPYPGLNGMELLTKLKTGYRLGKPDRCSGEIYNIMLDCWTRDPSERPNFENLVDKVNKLLEDVQEYEEVPDDKKEAAPDASYDRVDIHESLLDLLEICEGQPTITKNYLSSEDPNLGKENTQQESEKMLTSQPHVNMWTETNVGESKEPQREQAQKGSETISFCNEFYKLSEQQKSQQKMQDIGEF